MELKIVREFVAVESAKAAWRKQSADRKPFDMLYRRAKNYKWSGREDLNL
jgi:hypothetical protein